MKHLVEKLKREGILKTPRIIKAFTEINRADFMLEEFKDDYEEDIPMSINYGQTISQPLTVAFMLELLQPQEGDRIMDVGSGSAWSSALLAYIVGEEGKVYAVERIPQLKTFGENNLKKYGFSNIELFCGDGTRGLAEFAPFNCIQVAAAAQKKIPESLKEQLEIGGRLVIPVGQGSQEMILLTKKTKNNFKEEKYPGFQFVPLIEEE
ncbi:MAG: protein-L-isoaspartate O-methyltransferase [Patescibacteria group bacterium]|nr:protein-L-isoaspartate O-methyltransferase [Patescibacteria group bacterium]